MPQIDVTRGDTIDLLFTWRDGNGNLYDFTGCTAEIFDNDLCPAMTHTMVDAAGGQTRLFMEWPRDEDDMPDDAAILAFPARFWARPRIDFSPTNAKALERFIFNVR